MPWWGCGGQKTSASFLLPVGTELRSSSLPASTSTHGAVSPAPVLFFIETASCYVVLVGLELCVDQAALKYTVILLPLLPDF